MSYLSLHNNKCNIKPIPARCCFSIPPENIRKPVGFLIFSVGIEKEHWVVMG